MGEGGLGVGEGWVRGGCGVCEVCVRGVRGSDGKGTVRGLWWILRLLGM